MSGVNSYILRQVTGPVLFFAFVLTMVIWLSQSLRMLDLVVNDSQSVGTYLLITILIMPQIVSLVLPFAVFCGVLYALNRLYSESELIVIWATGFSQWSVAGPVLVVAGAATAICFFFNLVVMPAGMREMKDRVFEIRTELVNTFVREGAFTTPLSGLTVYVTQANAGGDIRGILIHDTRSTKATVTYMAERGLLANTPLGPRLIMFNGNVQWLEDTPSKLKLLDFKKYTFDLGQYDKKSRNAPRDASERYLSELLTPESDASLDQRHKYFADAHGRLSSPLYCLVLALIAALALLGGSFNRRGYGGRIALAMGALLVARIPGFLLQQMTSGDPSVAVFMYVWPLLWIAVLLFLLQQPRFDYGSWFTAFSPRTATP